jgi:hypothetical protein
LALSTFSVYTLKESLSCPLKVRATHKTSAMMM